MSAHPEEPWRTARISELEAENERLREVAHQIVGFSRTVQGDHPTIREIARNADAALQPLGQSDA
jgi:hypothetical protein